MGARKDKKGGSVLFSMDVYNDNGEGRGKGAGVVLNEPTITHGSFCECEPSGRIGGGEARGSMGTGAVAISVWGQELVGSSPEPLACVAPKQGTNQVGFE